MFVFYVNLTPRAVNTHAHTYMSNKNNIEHKKYTNIHLMDEKTWIFTSYKQFEKFNCSVKTVVTEMKKFLELFYRVR